jgi:hypothetical protein
MAYAINGRRLKAKTMPALNHRLRLSAAFELLLNKISLSPACELGLPFSGAVTASFEFGVEFARSESLRFSCPFDAM